jgi:aryl-alcohol dehydrogenase-like predicted oxidoreductase
VKRAALADTDLAVSSLCLGGNVFGWTADEKNSFEVLDAYVGAGGNFVDTADMYSVWAEGHVGGESETLVGKWMKERGDRSSVIVATKVAKLQTRPGLSAANIEAACDDSLKRLQTDYIDLYYAHEDDESVPMEETLGAFGRLVEAGKVRHIAASNFEAPRLAEALRFSADNDLPKYVAIQPQYSLLSRSTFEGGLEDVCQSSGLSAFPYWALASGYLTGKYQAGPVDSPRADGISRYANLPQSDAVLRELAKIADGRKVSIASIALSWCLSHPSVPSVIASARDVAQLSELVGLVQLSDEECAVLNAASTGSPQLP